MTEERSIVIITTTPSAMLSERLLLLLDCMCVFVRDLLRQLCVPTIFLHVAL